MENSSAGRRRSQVWCARDGHTSLFKRKRRASFLTRRVQFEFGLSFPAVAHVIIHIQEIEPGRDVFAFRGDFGVDSIEVFTAFGI